MENEVVLFYLVGAVISGALGFWLLSVEEKKVEKGETLQYGMIAVMVLLSWITIVMFGWGQLKNKKKEGH